MGQNFETNIFYYIEGCLRKFQDSLFDMII